MGRKGDIIKLKVVYSLFMFGIQCIFILPIILHHYTKLHSHNVVMEVAGFHVT